MADDFIETDHRKFLAGAKSYLLAANVLRNSNENVKTPGIYRRPILQLTAQGIENLLKGNLIGAGLSTQDMRTTFGHDLMRLWDNDRNNLLRQEAFQCARLAWERAKSDPTWPDSFTENPETLLGEYLDALSKLHTRETEFALRYISPSGTKAPQPHLLIDTFLPVADFCLHRPYQLLST